MWISKELWDIKIFPTAFFFSDIVHMGLWLILFLFPLPLFMLSVTSLYLLFYCKFFQHFPKSERDRIFTLWEKILHYLCVVDLQLSCNFGWFQNLKSLCSSQGKINRERTVSLSSSFLVYISIWRGPEFGV